MILQFLNLCKLFFLLTFNARFGKIIKNDSMGNQKKSVFGGAHAPESLHTAGEYPD